MNHTKVEFEPFEYSYYDYSDWYSNNAEPTKPPKEWVLNPSGDDFMFKSGGKKRKCDFYSYFVALIDIMK